MRKPGSVFLIMFVNVMSSLSSEEVRFVNITVWHLFALTIVSQPFARSAHLPPTFSLLNPNLNRSMNRWSPNLSRTDHDRFHGGLNVWECNSKRVLDPMSLPSSPAVALAPTRSRSRTRNANPTTWTAEADELLSRLVI
jgi:hypothetical protein